MKGGIVYTNAHFGQNKRLGVLVQTPLCPTGKETSLNDCQLTLGGTAYATDVGVACKVPCELGDKLGCCCIARKATIVTKMCITSGHLKPMCELWLLQSRRFDS